MFFENLKYFFHDFGRSPKKITTTILIVICLVIWVVVATFGIRVANTPNISVDNTTADNTTTDNTTSVSVAENITATNPTDNITAPVDIIRYPVISSVNITDISHATATISWRTNIPTTGEVEYWPTGGIIRQLKSDNTSSLTHTIKLTDLKTESPYSFNIRVRGATDNETTSKNGTFATIAYKISPEVGYFAPEFTLTDSTGKKISLGDFKGKWLIITFWETTCTYCRATMPNLQTFYTNIMTEKMAVVSVNVKDTAADLRNTFLQNWGITFPVLIDSDGAVDTIYKIEAYPTTFYIDPNGIIRKVFVGRYNNADEIASTINSLIGK